MAQAEKIRAKWLRHNSLKELLTILADQIDKSWIILNVVIEEKTDDDGTQWWASIYYQVPGEWHEGRNES